MPDVTLTEAQVRQLVSDEIQGQLNALETRIIAANRNSLTEALQDVPTEAEVSRMIESKLSATRQEFQTSINSIDAHLRSAEGRLSDSGRRMDDATQKLEGFLPELRQTVGKIMTSVESHEKRLEGMAGEMRTVRSQAEADRQTITHTSDELKDLRADIHGDATKPDMPSLFHMVRETSKSLSSLDTRLARYDNIYNLINRIWSTKLGKTVITVMLTAFATDAVYQATKILQALVTGKGTP